MHPAYPLYSRKSAARSRITLVEILIAIVILAVLAATSFLLVGPMKIRAQSATCVSNLRQLVMIANMEASEFWDPDVALLPMRHGGRANVAFCDGHVITISRISELKQKNLYWNY
ncbi:MAG: H-X9-DG-CTERM domain-containing protein [Akkermansiaceae bacterium]